MSSERQGKPSASNFPRYAQCPGSWQFEGRLAEQNDLCPEAEDASREAGIRCHDGLAREEWEHLPDREADVCSRLADKRERLKAQLFGTSEPDAEIVESRFWVADRWSAKPDYVGIWGQAGIVIDYKTGWGEHEDSDASLQLRGQIVALAYHYRDVTEWYGAILEPGGSFEIVRYAEDDATLSQATNESEGIIAKLYEPTPAIRTGPHCTYCPCRHRCAKFQEHQVALSWVDQTKIQTEQLPAFLESIPLAKKAIKAIEDYSKQLLAEDPEAIPGWYLKEGRLQREITDPQAAYEALSDTLEPAEFAQACKVQLSKLEALYKEKTGLTTTSAKKSLAGKIDAVVEEKRAAPQLAKKKEDDGSQY